MKTISNLLAAFLILSATLWAAGWTQDENLNPPQAENNLSAEWTITAPNYADPELGNELVTGYSEPVRVQLILHDDMIDLNIKFQSLGGDSLVRAFSVPGKDGNGNRICYVHVIMPTDWNDKQQLQSLGHEMMHCFGAHHIGDLDEET